MRLFFIATILIFFSCKGTRSKIETPVTGTQQPAVDNDTGTNSELSADISQREKEIEDLKKSLEEAAAQSQNDSESELAKQLEQAQQELERLEKELLEAKEGKVSIQSWQFLFVDGDGNKNCFEFANTLDRAPLRYTACLEDLTVSRQQFRIQTFASGDLFIDERTKKCFTADNSQAPDGSAVVISNCLEGDLTAQQLKMIDINVDDLSFKIRHEASQLCLKPNDAQRIILGTCDGNATLFSNP